MWGKRQNHMGKILPQDRTRNKIWNMSSTYPYLHLNEMSELLLDGILVEEIMNSMIMRWSAKPARRKRRDSLYLIKWWSRRIIWIFISVVKLWSEKIIWNGKEIYTYSFPKRTKIKTIYFTPNSLNSCKIVMWITCQYSNMMYHLSRYYMRLIKLWYIRNIIIWNSKDKGFSGFMRI